MSLIDLNRAPRFRSSLFCRQGGASQIRSIAEAAEKHRQSVEDRPDDVSETPAPYREGYREKQRRRKSAQRVVVWFLI